MEITVSGSVLTCMGIAMGVSLGLPFLYILTNRRKMMLVPVLIGILYYCVFSYLIAGYLSGGILSELGLSPWVYALVQAIVYGLVVTGGHYLAYKHLLKNRTGSGVPLSYALGYSLVRLVLVGGAQMFSNISLATAVNNNGVEKVASIVEDTEEFYQLIRQIADTPPHVYLLGGLEMICFFMITVSMSVLVWRAKEEKDMVALIVSLAGAAVSAFVMELYSAGGTENIILTESVYIAVAAAMTAYAYVTYRKTFGGPRYFADPVSRF
ncbi:MAG: YhfC family glutamic-type intramembrane protease [Oscillospiraceae bacterium]|jgi:uncharacterized membrane protein YhfC